MQSPFTRARALVQCKASKYITLIFIAISATNTTANACFGNENLQNMALRSGNDTSALIYVWSPRMVLSLTQAHLAQQAAQQLGLDFLPLLDARISNHERDQALLAAQRHHALSAQILRGSEALCASALIDADALRHFPTAFVLSARGTHHLPIVGAMPLSAWRNSIKARWKL
jgi:hypothetical protein